MDINELKIYGVDSFDEKDIDGINFANKDLSNIDLGASWIRDSYFENNIIENYIGKDNTYFGGGNQIHDSIFLNTKFINVEIYQMEINGVLFENCTFENVLFQYLDPMMDCTFKNCTFKNCTFKDAFSWSNLQDILFEDCIINGNYEFSDCTPDNLEFKNVTFDTQRAVEGVNVGTFDNRIILDEDESYKYFVEHSKFVDCDIKDPKLIEAIAMYPKKDNVETQNSQPELG